MPVVHSNLPVVMQHAEIVCIVCICRFAELRKLVEKILSLIMLK